MAERSAGRRVASIAGALMLILAGCAGKDEPVTGYGGVSLVIRWPEARVASLDRNLLEPRYLPAYSRSIRIRLASDSDQNNVHELIVDRPVTGSSEQQVVFGQLVPAGGYELSVVAKSDLGGRGSTVASRRIAIDVKPDKVFRAEVELQFALTIELVPDTLSLPVEFAWRLSVIGRDPSGTTTVIPPSECDWRLEPGGEGVIEITAPGVVRAVGEGVATVVVREPGAQLESQVTISSEAEREPGIVWLCTNQSRLYRFNLMTDQLELDLVTRSGNNSEDLSDIAWYGSGAGARLLGLGSGRRLLQVDHQTGQVTSLGVLPRSINGLTADFSGRLYGSGGDSLYVLEPGGPSMRGIAQLPRDSAGDLTFVPETGELAVSLTGGQMFILDPGSGSGRVVNVGESFFGAASTAGHAYFFNGRDIRYYDPVEGRILDRGMLPGTSGGIVLGGSSRLQ